jgi:hypothetical protein
MAKKRSCTQNDSLSDKQKKTEKLLKEVVEKGKKLKINIFE